MKPIPEVVYGDMTAHMRVGAKPESAKALAAARIAERPLEEIKTLASIVSHQIRVAQSKASK